MSLSHLLHRSHLSHLTLLRLWNHWHSFIMVIGVGQNFFIYKRVTYSRRLKNVKHLACFLKRIRSSVSSWVLTYGLGTVFLTSGIFFQEMEAWTVQLLLFVFLHPYAIIESSFLQLFVSMGNEHYAVKLVAKMVMG